MFKHLKKAIAAVLLTASIAYAGDAVIWFGNYGKVLPTAGLLLNGSDEKTINDLTSNPTSGAGVSAPIGSVGLYNNAGVGEFYIKTGAADTAWTSAGGGTITPGGSAWTIVGNTGTSSSNFIGTIDVQDLIFKTSGTERLRLTSSGSIDTNLGNGFVYSDATGVLSNSTIDISSALVTGILPIANGGTNNSSAFPIGAVAFSDGTKLTHDDSYFHWDTTNKRLNVGEDALSNSLTLNGTPVTGVFKGEQTGVNDIAGMLFNRHTSTTGVGAAFIGARSRGTSGAETVVQNGDRVASFAGIAHDGTDYGITSSIVMDVDGTPSNNNTPGKIVFSTTPVGASNEVEAFRLDSTKKGVFASTVAINGTLDSTSITDGALTVAGGVGISKALYAGKCFIAGSSTISCRNLTYSDSELYGVGSESTGGSSLAVGPYSSAQGAGGTAVGPASIAEGLGTAIGQNAYAFPSDFVGGDFAVGGGGSVSIGEGAIAPNSGVSVGPASGSNVDRPLSSPQTYDVAVGYNALASGTGTGITTSSVAMGASTFAAGFSVAVGGAANAATLQTLAFGGTSAAEALSSTALGFGARVATAHTQSIALNGQTNSAYQFTVGGAFNSVLSVHFGQGPEALTPATGGVTISPTNARNNAGTANRNATPLILKPGTPNGNASTTGYIEFDTPTILSASGTGLQSVRERFRLGPVPSSGEGEARFNNGFSTYNLRISGTGDSVLFISKSSDNNIGIGKGNPQEKLDIVGNLWVSGHIGKNTNSRASPGVVNPTVGLTGLKDGAFEKIWIKGLYAGDSNVSVNPQIQAGSDVGQQLIVFGRDDSSTVTFNDGNGLSLNGSVTLGADDNITLLWDGTNWVETARR